MIQSRPYEFMVAYTPQTQWIEKGGIKLWLAFFFIELGAGMFFVASLFDHLLAMSVGWFLCAVLGGGLHLLYLGKPLRFWRMAFSSGWKTSWISRGIIFVTLFLGLGLVYILLTQWASRFTPLLVAANIFAFLTVIYGGFAMNYVNGIPLWNTALLPILYVISGLWGGAEVTLGIALHTGGIEVGAAVEEWIRILLTGFVLFIPVYLISVRYTSSAGRISVRYMLEGKWAWLFWIAVVIVGMAVPVTAVLSTLFTGLEAVSPVFLWSAILCGLIGDLALRYLILKCGMYGPLVPSTVYE
jgi:sulfite dehydrogenase (quinone) subunit SoeC